MDTFADAASRQERNGAPEDVEHGSLSLARHKIEEVKAGLRDDPRRAYSIEFTTAAEVLRERDPVQFRSLRNLLKTKLIRLGEFGRLTDQRRRERERLEHRKRNRAGAAARTARTAHAIGQTPRAVEQAAADRSGPPAGARIVGFVPSGAGPTRSPCRTQKSVARFASVGDDSN
jgi:hypothetical protein